MDNDDRSAECDGWFDRMGDAGANIGDEVREAKASFHIAKHGVIRHAVTMIFNHGAIPFSG